jgi:hypothetical protein
MLQPNKSPAPKPAPAPPQSSTPPEPISQTFPNLPTSDNSLGTSPDVHEDSLSDPQRTAINLLLLGLSDTAVAKQLSVTRRTIYNWKYTDPHFSTELQRRRDEACDSTLAQFLNGIQISLDTLTKQAAHPYPPVSHRAAHTLLSLSRVGQHLHTLTDPKRTPK